MSYCRFGDDSDVYLFHSEDIIKCMCCSLEGYDGTEFIFRRDVIRHLRKHQSWDHKVPEYVFQRLERELALDGNLIREEIGIPVDELIGYMMFRTVREDG